MLIQVVFKNFAIILAKSVRGEDTQTTIETTRDTVKHLL